MNFTQACTHARTLTVFWTSLTMAEAWGLCPEPTSSAMVVTKSANPKPEAAWDANIWDENAVLGIRSQIRGRAPAAVTSSLLGEF